MRVKICGINSEAAFDAAVEAGADWVGLNFFPASPRAVSPERAKSLSSRSRGGPLRVGLFVDPTDADIDRVLDALPLDALQLYAPAARAAGVRARVGLPVWRAIAVSGPADLPREREDVDVWLVEPRKPEAATRPGGNAVAFDWHIASGWQPPLPWVLAGGLTPANVAEAIRLTGARAVDVSSGVEGAPGRKDPDLIRQFLARAKAA